MPENEPSYWDYVKAAFFARPRVKGLGEVPLNLLFVGASLVAGIWNPGVWLIAGAIEVAYLAWLSGSERFRKIVRGKKLLAQVQSFAATLERAVLQLSLEGRGRFRELERKAKMISDMTAQAGGSALPKIGELQASGLNSLLMIYARLLRSRDGVATFMREGSKAELERKIADAEDRLKTANSDAMRHSLQSNLEILKKRWEYRNHARENLAVVDSELERIENQVDLIREEATVCRDPAVLSARIDTVATTIGEANQFLKANEALLGTLGGEPLPEGPALPARTIELEKTK